MKQVHFRKVFNRSMEEWRIEVYENGIRNESATYYTDNIEDCNETLKDMQQKYINKGWEVK